MEWLGDPGVGTILAHADRHTVDGHRYRIVFYLRAFYGGSVDVVLYDGGGVRPASTNGSAPPKSRRPTPMVLDVGGGVHGTVVVAVPRLAPLQLLGPTLADRLHRAMGRPDELHDDHPMHPRRSVQ